MQQQLPEYFVLQTKYNDKYLSYTSLERDTKDFQLILKEDYKNSGTIFKAEVSSIDEVEFVSIKSSYNNKYLVVNKIENDEYLVCPNADTPNEDQSSQTCTLFKPCFVDENKSKVRFYHAHLKSYLNFSTISGLFLRLTDPEKPFDEFTCIDIKSLLPREVYAFKGDNKKYLSIYVVEDEGDKKENESGSKGRSNPYLKFFAADTKSSDVWFECPNLELLTKLHPEGLDFEIKSISGNSLLTVENSKWIVPSGTPIQVSCEENEHLCAQHNSTKFTFDYKNSAFKINDNYCQRFQSDHRNSKKIDFFIAHSSVFTEQARLHWEPKPKEES